MRSLTGSVTICACRLTEEEHIQKTYEADMAHTKQRNAKGILSPDSYMEEKKDVRHIRVEMLLRVRSAKFTVRLLLQCLDVSLLAS